MKMPQFIPGKRLALVIAGAVLLVVVGFVVFHGVGAWQAWRGIGRVPFDVEAARTHLGETTEDDASLVSPKRVSTDEHETVLVIGNDFDPDLPDRQSGTYADAVIYWIDPADGSNPILVSIPRDMLVVDPCTGTLTKLDRTLAGCGDEVSGPEAVAIAVERYTGIPVDHFVMFGLDTFVDVVDAVGGVQICVDHALRGSGIQFLPAGCSVPEGSALLQWVRSRSTQELVDGEWRFVEGVSDSSRSMRQQTLMLALLSKLKSMRSPEELVGIVQALGGEFILDDNLSMSQAITMAWGLRDTAPSEIRRLIIPTEPVVLDDGSFAVRSLGGFQSLLNE